MPSVNTGLQRSVVCCAFRNTFCSTKEDDDQSEKNKKKTHESKLEVHFFSFTTLYYLVGFTTR